MMIFMFYSLHCIMVSFCNFSLVMAQPLYIDDAPNITKDVLNKFLFQKELKLLQQRLSHMHSKLLQIML